jgi:hypothetical protein
MRHVLVNYAKARYAAKRGSGAEHLPLTATARALNLSERTVRRDWTLARAWLHRELRLEGDGDTLPE